jgi:UDP-3-O-[3-hydroxymyristoyl] glucosamine N-acyltransferase
VGADVTIGAQADIGPDVILESGAVIPGRTRLTAAPR